MAFFTRTQMTVPFIPDDDNCPTDGQTKTDDACDDKYVVSRSMGVEVWNHSKCFKCLESRSDSSSLVSEALISVRESKMPHFKLIDLPIISSDVFVVL